MGCILFIDFKTRPCCLACIWACHMPFPGVCVSTIVYSSMYLGADSWRDSACCSHRRHDGGQSHVYPPPVTWAPVNFSVWIGPDRPPSQDLHMTQTLASVFCWTPSRSRCIRTPPILCLGSLLKSPMEVEPCKGPNSYFGSSTTSELRGLLRASLISLVQ